MTLLWLFFLILVLLLGMAPVASVQQPQVVEEVEFLDSIKKQEQEPKGFSYIINTNGRWNTGPHVSISVSAESNVSAEAVTASINAISGNFTTSYNGTRWNDLLSSLPSSHAPMLVHVQENDVNIKLILTNSEHPDGKAGKARIYVAKDTREILSAEIEIYSADSALNQGVLDQIIIHELGHALGLSHSTNPESIMFHLLEVNNGSVINHIGACEERGLASLYVQSKTGPTAC